MLYKHIADAGVRRLAIIGLAKHAGKTTALNAILEEASDHGVSLSALSIGVDGERFDALIGVEKPAIHAPAGLCLATSAKAAEQATARLEWVETTGIASPLGEIVIARVAEPGTVLLAGVRQIEHVRQILGRLDKMGPTLHLIDGAFDRMASADPELVDGIILCTGASVGRTIDNVVHTTQAAVKRLLLPAVSEQWQLQAARLSRETSFMTAAGPEIPARPLAGSSPILHDPLAHPEWPRGASLLVLPGAVTDRVLDVLAGRIGTLVIRDATHLLCSLPAWKRFERKGGRILVERQVRIVAVTVNAYCVEGVQLPRRVLLERVREVAAGIPVLDCLNPELAVPTRGL